MMKNHKFDCLLVDPPWEYKNKKTGGTHKSGSSQHYETISAGKILDLYDDLQLDTLMDEKEGCCLFLWTTNSMLPDAICALELWGFHYKTMITWVKPNYGMGYWWRGKTEHLLFGIKGKVKAFRFNKPNIIYTEIELEHSQKPQQSYLLVQQAAQLVAFDKDKPPCILELFARKQYRSTNDLIRWECLGKQISGNNLEVDVQNLIALNTIKAK